MPAPKSFQDTIRELWELITAYGRQETLGPLRNLGRRVGLGIAGSLLSSFGWFLLALGVMRLLQTHVGFFQDHDWVTYLVGVGLLLLAMGVAALRLRRPDPTLTTPERAAR